MIVRQSLKNIKDMYTKKNKEKGKHGGGLENRKPKWKFFEIMSFNDKVIAREKVGTIYT